MNSLNSLRNFFKKNTRGSATDQLWVEGFHAFKMGRVCFRDKDQQQALDCFDRAIACGFEGEGIYGLRASSLQALDFELDAIDDFSRAILLAPEETNLYFMRSLSRGVTCDLAGRVSDLQEAIRLSKIDSKYNDFWNNYAKETGWPSATAYYEAEYEMALEQARMYREVEIYRQDRLRRRDEDSVRWRRPRNPGEREVVENE